MVNVMRRTIRRAANRLAAPYLAEISSLFAQTHGDAEESWRRAEEASRRVAALEHRIKAGLEVSLDALGPALDTAFTERLNSVVESRAEVRLAVVQETLEELREALHHVHENEAEQRRRLFRLRETPEYELAFSETEPLISYVIPTYDRYEKVRDVSLPSILAQTYPNIEAIVSGDESPAETTAVVADCGDPRVRFLNRTVRGPYAADRARRWYTIGTPPHNDGVAAARGRWIATLGDDDEVVPQHAEKLLAAAREDRLEHVYGRHRIHYPDGQTLEIGSFPPAKGEFVLQASLYHAGLRFFGMEPADYLYEEPNDWSLCRRMVVAGVRFGIVDDFLADKYESRYQSHDDWRTLGVPGVD